MASVAMALQLARVRRNKYGNRPVVIDGRRFASQAEGRRYQVLKIRELAGEISDLELQPCLKLVVEGHFICRYLADFRYREVVTGSSVVEDVKGKRTREYNLKKKLVKALFGIEIVEIQA